MLSKKIFCLRQVNLYSGVSEEELSKIASDSTDISYPAGTILFQDGETAEYMYVLKDGEVELFKTINGKKTILHTLFPGDVFGSFGNESYFHSAITIRKSYICKTSKDDFLKIIQNFPQLCLELMKVMAERTEEYEQKIAMLSSPAKDRLYEAIKILFQKKKKGLLYKLINLPFKISHQQLSEKTGLNRVTVTKLLKELQQEGKIEISSDTKEIVVH
jgi:CRP-like cAMP-binding protein